GSGQSLTLASRGKAAAAIPITRSKALLAISHHHVTSGLAYELDGCGWVGAVGHDVTGTDHVGGRNAQRCCALEQRLGCFQVAVGTAEEEQRSIGSNDLFRSDHVRIAGRSVPL